jgi:hypothetical protein
MFPIENLAPDSGVEVVVGKNTTPLLTDAQPLLSGQVLMVCQLQ